MAIQDLINEVNSIQTKKQAIKEAITSKGVTSEGKLSKFADEIKKISTSEPYWYMINRIRHENGNEGVCIRTNNKNMRNSFTYQSMEMGFGAKKDKIISAFSYLDNPQVMSGTFFAAKEAVVRKYATREYQDLPLSPQNDNYKIVFRDNTTITFDNINEFSFLKSYLNRPTADCFSLYIKGSKINNSSLSTFADVADVLNSGMQKQSVTVKYQGTNIVIPLISIDSSILVEASKYQTMNPAGFMRFDKDVIKIALDPVSYAEGDSVGALKNIDSWFNDLPVGNYAYYWFEYAKSQLVFVGINYIYTNDGTRKKNIEVYPYEIRKVLYNNSFDNVYPQFDKPVELYISFTSTVQQAINNASNISAFRKQVLTANGTPEA